jgi:chromosome segregation ATPase
MRKSSVVSFVLGFLAFGIFSSSVSAQQEVSGTFQAPQDQMAQELEKSRQMLEIWKDHVRELTQERDEAYQEIDRLKGGENSSQQFGIETAPLPGSAAQNISQYTQTIEALKSQISSLQSQNENLKIAEREVKELQEDKDLLTREKEQALAQLETVKKQGVARASSPDVEPLTRQRDEAYQEIEALKSQLTELRNRGGNDRLEEMEIQFQKMEAQKNTFEKLYTNLEYDFEKQGGRLKELVQTLDQLQAENARLSGELSRKQSLQQSYAELQNSFQAFREKTQALAAEKSDAEKEIQSLKTKLAWLEEQNARAVSLREELTQSRSARAEQAKVIEGLNKRLETSRTDLRNFKANVESYLESLTQRFEEGKK